MAFTLGGMKHTALYILSWFNCFLLGKFLFFADEAKEEHVQNKARL